MIVAILPARGGSKRIPRKNIRPFAGKPMIAYPIAAARESGLFDRILVSTEDEETAAVARAAGAEIPFMRPKDLADDYASSDAAVVHALEWLASRGVPADYVCCIYATTPFLRADDLRRGFDALTKNRRRYTFSAVRSPSPVQRAIRILPTGGIAAFFPEAINARSQDLDEAYFDAGQFYWADGRAFVDQVPFYESHTEAIVLPRDRAIDIDTEEDWIFAELIHRAIANLAAAR